MLILHDDPFPKGEPDAQRLVRVMAGLFRKPTEAIELAEPFGFDVLALPDNLSPIDRWYCIFEQLAPKRRVAECVRAARLKFPDNKEGTFLDQLLAVVPDRMEVTPGFLPWQYLGLFDRVVESSVLAEHLFRYSTPPPLNPVVIGVLAERADEYTFFLERLRDEILRGLYENTQWQEEMIQWAPTAAVSAEFELRKIAATKPGGNRGAIADVLARLRPALAGRSLWLVLRSNDLRTPGMKEKLGQFLALWGQLGMEAPPPVLCVAIVRWDEGDLSLQEAEPIAAAAFAQARDSGLIAIDPVTLSICDVSHFDEWQWVLTKFEKKVDQIKFDRLKKSFTAPFRLSQLKDRLAEGPIYT